MSQSTIDEAIEFLRSHTRGDLRFDEHLRPIKYVIVPDGRLAAPVMVAMIESVDCVLFVPDCSEFSMELGVTLVPFQESGVDGAAADRWRIYHGEPPDVCWAFLSIDAVRFGELVIDGEALMHPNPLAKDEPHICRHMNQNQPEDLRRLCAHYANIELEHPVMVGIDSFGIDVRARFEVVRVPMAQPITTADEARRVLESMNQDAKLG